MIGQAILSAPLAAMVVYGLLEYKRSRLIGTLIPMVSIGAISFVWFPALAAIVANALGVPTRDDLILYAWVGIFFLVLINLHLKNRLQMRVMTALARQLAITNPKAPKTSRPAHQTHAIDNPGSTDRTT